MIDIGANIAHHSFDEDREDVLQRAGEAGVEKIIVTGSCLESVPAALALAGQHPGFLHATAGIHPHHAEQVNDEAIEVLYNAADDPLIVATGEMGLDFFRDFSPRDVQERALHKQLEMAANIGKPVFLHQRDAHQRFLPILKEYLPALPAAVVHCFTGTKEELYAYLDQDLHIGITGWICDERRGQHLWELVGDIPENRLMVETDSPYLLPRTLKPRPSSRRNEPMYLPCVVEMVANLLDKPFDRIAQQTSQTARDFFRVE